MPGRFAYSCMLGLVFGVGAGCEPASDNSGGQVRSQSESAQISAVDRDDGLDSPGQDDQAGSGAASASRDKSSAAPPSAAPATSTKPSDSASQTRASASPTSAGSSTQGDKRATAPAQLVASDGNIVLTDVEANVIRPESAGEAPPPSKPVRPAPAPAQPAATSAPATAPASAKSEYQITITDQKVEIVGPDGKPLTTQPAQPEIMITDQQVTIVEPGKVVPATQPGAPATPIAPAAPKAPGNDAPPAAPAAAKTQTPPTTTAAAGPSWACDEPTHNFGTVWTGTDVKWTFKIRSVGTEALQILKVKPTCGCTVAQDYTREVPPGETGSVTLVINTNKLANDVAKTINVETNDPVKPNIALVMQGTIKTLFTVTPTEGANFIKFEREAPTTKEIMLKNNTEEPVKLELDSMAGSKVFSAKVEEIDPGKEVKVIFTATPPYVPGANTANITFKTGHPRIPSYMMTANLFLPPRIQVNPPKLVIDKPADKDSFWMVHVFNNGKTPLNIKGIRTNKPELKPMVTATTPTPGVPAVQQYEIRITVPKGYRPPPEADMIELTTDDEEKPVLEIPLQPSFAPPTPRPADQPLQMIGINMSTGEPMGAASQPAGGKS